MIKKKQSGQQALLYHLWRMLGGPTKLAQQLDIPRQDLFNWHMRGKVPFRLALRLSRGLKVSRWGLNYEETAEYEGVAPVWPAVVKSYGFPEAIVKAILALKWPKDDYARIHYKEKS